MILNGTLQSPLSVCQSIGSSEPGGISTPVHLLHLPWRILQPSRSDGEVWIEDRPAPRNGGASRETPHRRFMMNPEIYARRAVAAAGRPVAGGCACANAPPRYSAGVAR